MADLTGAELALAVARVMGLRDVYEEDETVWRGDGSVYRTEKFRPDQGGAAAWEVLEWARGRYEVIFAEQHDDLKLVWCGISTDAHNRVCHVAGAYGPTDAIALCRAVVALGEAG